MDGLLAPAIGQLACIHIPISQHITTSSTVPWSMAISCSRCTHARRVHMSDGERAGYSLQRMNGRDMYSADFKYYLLVVYMEPRDLRHARVVVQKRR